MTAKGVSGVIEGFKEWVQTPDGTRCWRERVSSSGVVAPDCFAVRERNVRDFLESVTTAEWLRYLDSDLMPPTAAGSLSVMAFYLRETQLSYNDG